jgi:hypothetical protein
MNGVWNYMHIIFSILLIIATMQEKCTFEITNRSSYTERKLNVRYGNHQLFFRLRCIDIWAFILMKTCLSQNSIRKILLQGMEWNDS